MAAKHGNVVVDESVAHVTSILADQHEHAVVDEYTDSDAVVLAALGYKQEFKRDFSIVECFSVSFSVLGLLPSIAATFFFALGYSGLGGMTWGWIVAAIMIQSTSFSMAELCSSMPTAGGLYYAAAVMAPEGWGPLAAWFTGWSNFFGFVSGPASLNYALAFMLVTAGEIAYPGYRATNWQIYLVYLGLLISQAIMSMQSTKFVGRLNVGGTIFNVLMVIIFIVWFPVGANKFNSSTAVWTTFQNGTQWPLGWAVIMGFLTAIWTMAGYDAAFHLSEECSNANIAAPRSIVMTSQLGMYLGFGMVLVIVYTVQNVGNVLLSEYGQPFGSLCLQVLGKNQGLALFSLNMVALWFSANGCLLTATRIVFAYSRDGALIGSKLWRKIDPHTKTPRNGTFFVTGLAAVLGLLIFGGPVVINAIFTIGAIGQYTAFTAPVFLKLFFSHERFKPGPWNLGRFSRPVNAIAVVWWCVITPALCFPYLKGDALTNQTMNWTIVLYGGCMALVMGYYAVSARKWFKGPRINIEHIHATDNGSGRSHASDDGMPNKE